MTVTRGSSGTPPFTRHRNSSTTARDKGGQEYSHAPQLHVITYNPMTVKHEGRLADIFRHFQSTAAIILLQGTCLKDHEDEGAASNSQCEGFWV